MSREPGPLRAERSEWVKRGGSGTGTGQGQGGALTFQIQQKWTQPNFWPPPYFWWCPAPPSPCQPQSSFFGRGRRQVQVGDE